MFVSIQEAINLTGKSRSTFQRYIKEGKLSKTDKGIDTAELLRVFGEFKDHDNKPENQVINQTDINREQWLISQIEALQNDIRQLRAESLEREKRLLNLLEHQTGAQSPTETSGGLFSKLFK